MRRILSFTHNEKGFILPHVLVIVTILFIYILNSIYIYQKEVDLTYFYKEQLVIETLFQKSHYEMKRKFQMMESQEDEQIFSFKYPMGKVEVEFVYGEEEFEGVYLLFDIKTNQGSSTSFIKSVNFNNN